MAKLDIELSLWKSLHSHGEKQLFLTSMQDLQTRLQVAWANQSVTMQTAFASTMCIYFCHG
jgi:hypothetical protein